MYKTTTLSILAFLIINLYSNILSAQKESILNNPDISWAAEFTSDYTFSLNTPISEERVKLFKLIDDQESINSANSSNWPIRWIVEQAFAKQYQCYKDPGLTQALSLNELSSIITTRDTINTFDPYTYEKTVRIVSRDLHSSMVKYLRVNQIIFYNKRANKFSTLISSVAPLISNSEKEQVPVFWIKMDKLVNSDFAWQSADISWAALAYTRNKSSINLNFLDVIKNEENIEFRDFIYQQAKSQEHPVSLEYSGKTLLDKETFATIYNSIDTIVTFDPETYEEQVTIVKNELRPESINQFRLVQKWYYDQKSKQLLSELVAISPVINVRDDNGKFKFSRAIYYIRYD